MSALSITSIILFSISALLFIVFIVVFISTDVLTSIKYLKNRESSNENANIPLVSINSENNSVMHFENSYVQQKNHENSGGIEYAQQTVDTDDLEETQTHPQFETQDWDLPDGVTFVLTKNIIVVHSEKEYIVRENR